MVRPLIFNFFFFVCLSLGTQTYLSKLAFQKVIYLYLLFFFISGSVQKNRYQKCPSPSPSTTVFLLTLYYIRKYTIYMGPLPIETLHNLIIQEYGLVEEVDVYAANVFVKVRFFHRIKILNESVKANEMKQKAQFMF